MSEEVDLLKGVKFVRLDQCAQGIVDKKGAMYCAHGYPVSKNKINWKIKTQFDSYAQTYSALLFDNFDYESLDITLDTHIAIKYDPKKIVDENGNKKLAPDTSGMSGGGLWVYPDPKNISKETFVGILIEDHNKATKKQNAILAIRIDAPLVLIKKLYPDEIPDKYVRNRKISINILEE